MSASPHTAGNDPHRTSPSAPRAFSFAARLPVLGVLGFAFVALRQHVFSIDSLYYLWDTEFAGWTRLLHPHHLILEPLLRGWWRVWQLFGWPGRSLPALQALSVVITLVWLELAARLLAVLVRDRAAACAGWLMLCASYLTWSYATQAEGVPFFALFGTAFLLWGAALPGRGPDAPVTPRTAVAVAATITVGALLHQSLVLWSPLLVWMLAREAPAGRRWRYGAGTLAASGVAVLACYLIAGAWATGSTAPGDLWRWFTGYRQEFAGRCGEVRLLLSMDVPRGIASSLLTGAPLKVYAYGGRSLDATAALRAAPYAAVALLVAVGLLQLRGAYVDRDCPGRRALVNVFLLVLVGSLFAGWWEPANRKFWAPVLAGLLALAATGWGRWRRRRPRPALGVAVLVLTLTAAYNVAGGILPRHRLSDERQPLLVFLARTVRPADAVVLREDRVWQCVNYFRPDAAVHALPGPVSDRDDPPHTVFRLAVADARRALLAGATLYVAAGAWPALRDALVAGNADTAGLGELPEPSPVLRFGDLELVGNDQVLLALRLPAG